MARRRYPPVKAAATIGTIRDAGRCLPNTCQPARAVLNFEFLVLSWGATPTELVRTVCLAEGGAPTIGLELTEDGASRLHFEHLPPRATQSGRWAQFRR